MIWLESILASVSKVSLYDWKSFWRTFQKYHDMTGKHFDERFKNIMIWLENILREVDENIDIKRFPVRKSIMILRERLRFQRLYFTRGSFTETFRKLQLKIEECHQSLSCRSLLTDRGTSSRSNFSGLFSRRSLKNNKFMRTRLRNLIFYQTEFNFRFLLCTFKMVLSYIVSAAKGCPTDHKSDSRGQKINTVRVHNFHSISQGFHSTPEVKLFQNAPDLSYAPCDDVPWNLCQDCWVEKFHKFR